MLWCNCRFGHIHKGVAKVNDCFSKVHDELTPFVCRTSERTRHGCLPCLSSVVLEIPVEKIVQTNIRCT
jgi:hypothetical protein